MATPSARFLVSVGTGILLLLGPATVAAQFPHSLFFPEHRSIPIRDPAELAPSPRPDIEAPATVARPPEDRPAEPLTLDEAIRIALANSEVVRVLGGVTSVSSGRSVYDVAITNVTVDEAGARFDPALRVDQSLNRFENPVLAPFAIPPAVTGSRGDNYNLDFRLSQPTVTGGRWDLGVNATPTRTHPGDSQQSPSSVDLSFTQPLWQGGGPGVNLAPVVLARIDTERSFFQLKDAVQELVRGVIDAYWQLVLARTDVWVRQQQVAQLEEAYARSQAQANLNVVDQTAPAQARVALGNFRATLLSAEANLYDREAALRSILGLPPIGGAQMVPHTPPRSEQLDWGWEGLLALAGERRPDIIELKLILEADQQRLLQADNLASPRLDAVALYRWNGLEGEIPGGPFASRPGQFNDWTLGINFSVPLGLRSERANLRRQELLVARDAANLQQSLHETAHRLALRVRTLDLLYRQYEVFRETRQAARFNVDAQFTRFRLGQQIFLVVLQAVSDWGNAVNAEASSLLRYNIELANLERDTGTILESHEIRFFEERFGHIGPFGRHHLPQSYPRALRPAAGEPRYPHGQAPSEEAFRLEDPTR